MRIRGAGKVLCFVKFGVFYFLITTVFRFILLPSYQIWSLGKCLFKISNWLISSPHKKGSFTLRISSVNVTKSSGNSLFDHIYRGNPWQKTSFFVQCNESVVTASSNGNRYHRQSNHVSNFQIPSPWTRVYLSFKKFYIEITSAVKSSFCFIRLNIWII